MSSKLNDKLPLIGEVVTKKDLATIKKLHELAKAANKCASNIPISDARILGKEDVFIRLQRNAASLSMMYGIIEDLYINMRSEIGEIFYSLQKEDKKKKKRLQAVLHAQRNIKYRNKKEA